MEEYTNQKNEMEAIGNDTMVYEENDQSSSEEAVEITKKTDEIADQDCAPDNDVEAAQGETTEPDVASEATELQSLQEEIKNLRNELSQLEELKQNSQRLISELNEFTSIFPQRDVNTLPDEVWNTVKNGSSLAAAYALYEKKREIAMRHAEEINAQNSRLSAGQAGVNTSSEYFTVDEVNRMSHAEVRANYEKIRESMKKWNYNHN